MPNVRLNINERVNIIGFSDMKRILRFEGTHTKPRVRVRVRVSVKVEVKV